MTPTYPADRSNEPKSNNFPFRDLAIVNQPAGGTEFVNTKDDEMVTHYYKDGSFLRFQKFGTDLLVTKDKREHVMGNSYTEVNGDVVQIYDKNVETITLGDSLVKTGDIDKWQPYQDKIKESIKEIHDLKRLYEVRRVKYKNFIDQAPKQIKDGALALCPVEATVGTVLYTVNPTVYIRPQKIPCGAANMPLIFDNETINYKATGGGGKIDKDGWDCMCCWGTGDSPSSQDGIWKKETLKDQISKKRVDVQKKIFDYEKHLGQNKHRDGGSIVHKAAKDYMGVFGLTFNDFESFRKDPKGKLVPHSLRIDPFGAKTYVNYREATQIEHVDVDRFPGGSYDLVIADRYNLTVGSGGIDMKTSGPMEVYAPLIHIGGEDVAIASKGDFRIGGERVDINAEIITLRPKKVKREIEDSSGNIIDLPANGKTETEYEQEVLVDGNLGISKNVKIAGGLHVEGEMTLQHMTAPCNYYVTDGCFEWGVQSPCVLDPTTGEDCTVPVKSPVFADIQSGCLIGYAIVGGGSSRGVWPVLSVCSPNSTKVHDHMHYYKGPPMKLIRDFIETEVTVGAKTETKVLNPNAVVRAIGARNDYPVKVMAKPVVNSQTETTILEKFGGSLCEKLVINNGTWVQPSEDDTLPVGEGVRTQSTTDEILFAKVKELEKQLEDKYKELQKKLDEITKSK